MPHGDQRILMVHLTSVKQNKTIKSSVFVVFAMTSICIVVRVHQSASKCIVSEMALAILHLRSAAK